jgi:hypothetical protein
VQSGKFFASILITCENFFTDNVPTVLSQAMQEEFRGFSYSADFV